MPAVIVRNAVYEAEVIRSIVFEMLSSAEAPTIEPGARVLIKPNFLAPAAPARALTTHPLIVRAAAEFALAKGARVQISDSPALANFAKLLKKGGYTDGLEGLDVTLKPFEESIGVDIGEPFGIIEVAKDAMEADVVINLAKLKTHTQMMLTLGVKNIFGCIVGLRKPEWHMRAGVDRLMFARLLVQIHQAVRPAFTIVDGILALEGQGPGKSGTPRELGLLVGGSDAHAVDKTICTLLGLDPGQLLTGATAREMGLYDGNVHVNGDLRIVEDFKFPELNSLSMGPESFSRFMRRYVIQKPVVDNKKCKLCGECWKICPAKAISHNVRGVQFDYNLCIRCYCCLEVCLHGAIRAKEPVLGQLRRRLIR